MLRASETHPFPRERSVLQAILQPRLACFPRENIQRGIVIVEERHVDLFIEKVKIGVRKE